MMKIINFLFRKHKYITMSAVIMILIIAIISVSFCFFFDNSKKDIKGETESQAPLSIVSDDPDNSILAGDSSVLLVCNSNQIGETIFIGILDFHIFAEEIVLIPLNPETSDGAHTYAESYSYGGIDNLIRIVEKVRNCHIDRFAIIDESGICKLTDIMGKVNLYVSEDYTYESSDKSYSVNSGYNDLEASMLYTYLEINSAKENGEAIIADIICTIINLYLSGIEIDDTQELFEDLCNCISTDIAIADYYTASDDINYLVKNESKCIVNN